MNILLTGATGYIGKRLLPELVDAGHFVTCVVRDKNRFEYGKKFKEAIHTIEVDFLKENASDAFPKDIDVAYYLIHSMSSSSKGFQEMEEASAGEFVRLLAPTNAKQIVYLSGISNHEELSPHLQSRKSVENILMSQTPEETAVTVLRAGIIVGSGSASFEIIRDIVEKLPVMVAPRWLNTLCQPIGIADVLGYLNAVALNEDFFDDCFDIGGPEVLTYKEMLYQYAEVRKLKRWIFIVPVMTPRLSSYWLYFITSTSYKLAVNLVDSMKLDVVCRDDRALKLSGIQPISYRQAVKDAFLRIDQNIIVSSWKDAYVSSHKKGRITDFIDVPAYGCFEDKQEYRVDDVAAAKKRIWSLGGKNGWYFATWLWKLRGVVDKFVGGVGLRRGRTHPNEIFPGDALDFWRVIIADEDTAPLLLYAEMRLPGEAWLEYTIIKDEEGNDILRQKATFRPWGIAGRAYWIVLFPFHDFIFSNMAKRIARGKK